MLTRILMGSAILAASLSFSGCGDSESSMTDLQIVPKYEVSMTNLTAAQPMSPLAVVLHGSNYHMYTLGEGATVALEKLAEGGDNSVVLDGAMGTTNVDEALSSEGLLLPGAKTQVVIEGTASYLSIASMLVNTNDGFVGLESYHLSDLARGESVKLSLSTYDAGTEANSESAASVPAQQGEGFNVVRDDTNAMVRYHAGVVSSDDGLSSSALSAIHRFDNPTATLMIKRIN